MTITCDCDPTEVLAVYLREVESMVAAFDAVGPPNETSAEELAAYLGIPEEAARPIFHATIGSRFAALWEVATASHLVKKTHSDTRGTDAVVCHAFQDAGHPSLAEPSLLCNVLRGLGAFAHRVAERMAGRSPLRWRN